MDETKGWMQTEILGNTPMEWAVAIGITAIVVLAVMLAKPILIRRLTALSQRTHTSIDDALVQALRATRLLLVAIVALSIGTQGLELGKVGRIIEGAATLALFLQVGLWASALLAFWLEKARQRALASNSGAATHLSAMGFIGRLVLWTLVVLLALDNLGVNITTAIAGLGIGGIAVALAVQNILGDLFASLSIVIDKPFVIGDFIIVNEYMGSVEYVGLKTTRIRSLGGEQIIFSNSDLLNARVRNYKRMYERRVVFKFGALYRTTPEQLEQVPPMVKRLIEAHGDKVRFDRAHFFAFGESSLDFEVVFWVKSPDYNIYMDIQQAVNLALLRELAAMKIELAFPTRTLYVEGPLRVESKAAAPGDGREPPRPALKGNPPPVNPS